MDKLLEVKSDIQLDKDLLIRIKGIDYVFINPFYTDESLSLVKDEDGKVGCELKEFLKKCIAGNISALFLLSNYTKVKTSNFPIDKFSNYIPDIVNEMLSNNLLRNIQICIDEELLCKSAGWERAISYYVGLALQVTAGTTLNFTEKSPVEETTEACIKKLEEVAESLPDKECLVTLQLIDAVVGYYIQQTVVNLNKVGNVIS